MPNEIVYLIDGYNVLFAWSELDEVRASSLEEARLRFVASLSDFQAFVGFRVVVVFDAQHVSGNSLPPLIHSTEGVEVLFTREAETADERIEKMVQRLLGMGSQVYVVTSDYLEQRISFAHGAYRISAREFYREWRGNRERLKGLMQKGRMGQTARLEDFLTPQAIQLLERWRRCK